EGGAGLVRVVHRQRDAGHNHDHQRDASEWTEIPPVAEVFRSGVVVEFVVEEHEYWQPIIYPPNNFVLEDWSLRGSGHRNGSRKMFLLSCERSRAPAGPALTDGTR